MQLLPRPKLLPTWFMKLVLAAHKAKIEISSLLAKTMAVMLHLGWDVAVGVYQSELSG